MGVERPDQPPNCDVDDPQAPNSPTDTSRCTRISTDRIARHLNLEAEGAVVYDLLVIVAQASLP